MNTEFASSCRSSETDLKNQAQSVSKEDTLMSYLQTSENLVMILNKNREIIAVNQTALNFLGLKSPEECFGNRPGEAVHCAYSKNNTGGCGTSKTCRSCGAILAILEAQEKQITAVKLCALRVKIDNITEDLAFEVSATAVTIEEKQYVIVNFRDIRKEKLRMAIETTFFHDINNVLCALMGNSELLDVEGDKNEANKTANDIRNLTFRISREIEIQRALLYSSMGKYEIVSEEISFRTIIDDCRITFEHYHANDGDKIHFDSSHDLSETIHTDITLLMRILINMLKNALEASNYKEQVTLSINKKGDSVEFSVWNPAMIQQDIQSRIFQGFFSTKSGNYHGIGTYSMKLFCEQLLGGSVSFTSDESGTTFRCVIPNCQTI